MLAAAPSRTLTRDRLTGLLWPEKDDEQARHLLSVATYEIRKELGEEVIVTRGDDVALDPVAVRADLDDFDDALEQQDFDAAIALYRGPFMDGFFLGGSAAFDEWMEGERNQAARRYRQAQAERAERIEASGDPGAAAEAWRSAANENRFDSRVALRYLQALDAAGNRAGALQFARVHESLLQDEFGTAPDPAFTRAVEDIREGRSAPALPRAPTPGPGPAPIPTTTSGPGPGPGPGPGSGAGSPVTQDIDSTAAAAPTRRSRPTPRAIALAVLFLVVAGLIGYLVGPDSAAGVGEEGIRVAVLPFSHPDPADEAFADGLSEEIMDALGQVSGVRVPAWSAAVALRGVGAREAAARLGADHVVEGRVHREGDSLRIRVQLSGPDGFATWTESYDRSAGEVFATWDEIALAVLDAMEIELGARRIREEGGGTTDLVAYDLFVKGRHAWFQRTPDGLGQAIAYFRQAVARDPDYARAHAGLADAYNVMGAYDYGVLPPDSAFPMALRSARRALELAPNLGEAHAALANALFAYQRDWEAADRAYRRAIELYPHYPEAHHWYSLFLIARCRDAEAIREAERALELDSLSPVMRTSMARHLYFRGDAAAALDAYRRALGIEPGFVTAHLGAGLALLELGRYDDAIASFRRANDLISRPHPLSLALTANAHGRAGRLEEARAILRDLDRIRAGGAWVPPEYFALVHLGLGDHDRAILAFEQAVETRSSAVPFFGIEPLAKEIREEPRFRTLIARGR